MDENIEVNSEVVEHTAVDTQPAIIKKTPFFERKARMLGSIITIVAFLLLMAQTVISAVSVFTEATDVVGYVGFFVGYIAAAVLMLLPGFLMSGIVRKGKFRFVKATVSVILSVLFLLSMLVILSMTDTYSVNVAVIAMLCVIYLADLYVASCVVVRKTKLYGSKAKNILTVIGCVATAALTVVLIVSIVKMIIDALSSITAVFLADTIFAVVCYFSFIMFIFSGMLSLHIKEK